ncbi:hypothetical protein ACFO9Q_00450 [Paenibacillus sp. GCM10023252]|uniref:hypothetical protein n=1 Tax=Paenibacillus sp. GCM10023252 TaxID=3252649 RepID=UPI0036241663
MLYLVGSVVFVLLSMAVFLKAGVKEPFSRCLLMSISVALLAVICLTHNYLSSLSPDLQDGIGISNKVAYWIIGEDGWSVARFRSSLEQSSYGTIILIVAYPMVVVLESRRMK